eukprot:tig00001229_g7848.t1
MMGGMASNMISNYVLTTYQAYQQDSSVRSVSTEDWVAQLPQEDVAYWRATITEDDAEQEHMQKQAPFSSIAFSSCTTSSSVGNWRPG